MRERFNKTTYTNGHLYRGLQPRLDSNAPIPLFRHPAVYSKNPFLASDWPSFWRRIRDHLRRQGYQLSTLRVYRQVLRSFRTFIKEQTGSSKPASATARLMQGYLWKLTQDECSWSWVSTNISVLRTAFDKLCGMSITAGVRSPKRKYPLSDILSENEVNRMMASLPRVRDKLLIGFMYGCGLKVSEAVSLRWGDVELDHVDPIDGEAVLSVTGPRARRLPLPNGYRALMIKAQASCSAEDYIFRGRSEGSHLSARTVERIVKKAAKTAEITKVVCCMTLRHSYAVACLRAGDNLLQLMLNLGHRHLETTEKYMAYIPGTTSSPSASAASAPMCDTSPSSESHHPASHECQIDADELDLGYDANDSAVYAFLSDLPFRSLFMKKPG